MHACTHTRYEQTRTLNLYDFLFFESERITCVKLEEFWFGHMKERTWQILWLYLICSESSGCFAESIVSFRKRDNTFRKTATTLTYTTLS